jgi:phage tail-like protein
MPQVIDRTARVRGFTVEISGSSAVDSHWHTCTGGAFKIDIEMHTAGPQPLEVTDVTLTGHVTPANAVMDWVKATLAEPVPPRRHVTIVEIMKDGSDGKRFMFENCFITEYEPPRFDATSNDLLEEKVTFKPERLVVS